MTVERKRKFLYLLLKVSSVIISCIFPIWAVCVKFPVWNMYYGTVRSVGVGAIIIMIVLVIIFRKAVFSYLSDKFKLKHAPPIAIWLTLLIVSYILIYLGNFMRDLTTVLWMGVIGCGIGTALTFVGENYFGDKETKETDDGRGT